MARGRKPLFRLRDDVQFAVRMSEGEYRALHEVLPLVRVQGFDGEARPIAKAELVREAVRQVVSAIRRGRFRGVPQVERGDERPIVRVLKPGQKGGSDG